MSPDFGRSKQAQWLMTCFLMVFFIINSLMLPSKFIFFTTWRRWAYENMLLVVFSLHAGGSLPYWQKALKGKTAVQRSTRISTTGTQCCPLWTDHGFSTNGFIRWQILDFLGSWAKLGNRLGELRWQTRSLAKPHSIKPSSKVYNSASWIDCVGPFRSPSLCEANMDSTEILTGYNCLDFNMQRLAKIEHHIWLCLNDPTNFITTCSFAWNWVPKNSW